MECRTLSGGSSSTGLLIISTLERPRDLTISFRASHFLASESTRWTLVCWYKIANTRPGIPLPEPKSNHSFASGLSLKIIRLAKIESAKCSASTNGRVRGLKTEADLLAKSKASKNFLRTLSSLAERSVNHSGTLQGDTGLCGLCDGGVLLDACSFNSRTLPKRI